MSDDERIAYLAGDRSIDLSADERDDLDAIRTLLADPSVWVEPNPALEDRVVAAVVAARAGQEQPPIPRRRNHWIRNTIIGVAAALILTAGIVSGLRQTRTAAPLAYGADLQSTALSTGATGTANLTQTTSGWQIQLHALGLPRRDGGEFYEAWLKNKAGVLVPIGTFNEPTDVTLWAGVSPADFPTMTVTRQQANGNQASSGEVVLTGTAHRTN